MALRQFNFGDPAAADLQSRVVKKQEKLKARMQKVLAAKKRWLRKLRLASTKLKKLSLEEKRIEKQFAAAAAQLKG